MTLHHPRQLPQTIFDKYLSISFTFSDCVRQIHYTILDNYFILSQTTVLYNYLRLYQTINIDYLIYYFKQLYQNILDYFGQLYRTILDNDIRLFQTGRLKKVSTFPPHFLASKKFSTFFNSPAVVKTNINNNLSFLGLKLQKLLTKKQ